MYWDGGPSVYSTHTPSQSVPRPVFFPVPVGLLCLLRARSHKTFLIPPLSTTYGIKGVSQVNECEGRLHLKHWGRNIQVGGDVGEPMADSWWCLVETNAILQSNYPSIKNKFKNPKYVYRYVYTLCVHCTPAHYDERKLYTAIHTHDLQNCFQIERCQSQPLGSLYLIHRHAERRMLVAWNKT